MAEIERKFLVTEMPRAESGSATIEQGYLALDRDAEVRLRRAGDELFLTAKSGHGEILCDGKTTKIGPGSVMYTTPNAQHGITNTGEEPIVFYYVKWESRK